MWARGELGSPEDIWGASLSSLPFLIPQPPSPHPTACTPVLWLHALSPGARCLSISPLLSTPRPAASVYSLRHTEFVESCRPRVQILVLTTCWDSQRTALVGLLPNAHHRESSQGMLAGLVVIFYHHCWAGCHSSFPAR